MSAELLWFYESQGDRQGPVPQADLIALRQRGEISSDTLVWSDGFAEWVPYAQAGLPSPSAQPAASGPPPVPALVPAGPPPVPAAAAYVPRVARLRAGFQPSIRSSYGRAWELLKTRFWPFVGCFALMSVILGFASQFYIPVFFLMFPLMGGFYWYALRHLRGHEVTLDALFEGFRRQFGPLAIANLIVSGISLGLFVVVGILITLVVVGLGAGGVNLDPDGSPAMPILIGVGLLLLFVVLTLPLLVVGVVGNLATMLILDCEIKAGEALSLCWTAIKPHLWKIVIFMFLNGFLSFAGILALYFGVFITGTWASIALVYLYEDAFGEDPAAGTPVLS
ncbi:MAG: DUF4339 domain-containing protein [Verrucomicrobiae bacterium]|nr:DUF4339 domain-containing protein [Verrucomicrobiae bacterium]